MLGACVSFACMSVCVRMLHRLPVLEIIFFRALLSSVLCFFGLLKAGVPILGNRHGLLILRGCAGALALAQGFWLLQNVPLGVASTLTHLSPIFTSLLGIWFVGEAVSRSQIFWYSISFIGIVMVQGFDYRIELSHLVLGITTSFTMALAYNCVRKLGSSEHPLVIILYFPLICLPATGFWSLLHWIEPIGIEWWWIISLGLCSQIGQYCMTRSYQTAAIAKVSIVNYSEVLFAILLGYLIFDENYGFLTYFGMTLVALGVILSVVFRPSEKVSMG
jgi:drug/metabolite transporter (DMT)-like permease